MNCQFHRYQHADEGLLWRLYIFFNAFWGLDARYPLLTGDISGLQATAESYQHITHIVCDRVVEEPSSDECDRVVEEPSSDESMSTCITLSSKCKPCGMLSVVLK